MNESARRYGEAPEKMAMQIHRGGLGWPEAESDDPDGRLGWPDVKGEVEEIGEIHDGQ